MQTEPWFSGNGSRLMYEGRGFKSQHHILVGLFLTCICRKNCNDVCFKRPKINEKRPECGFIRKV